MIKNKYIRLMILLKLLFLVAIADTFLTEWLQSSGFFGDELYGGCAHQAFSCFDGKWYWGWRHYLWFWSNVITFVMSAIYIVVVLV